VALQTSSILIIAAVCVYDLPVHITQLRLDALSNKITVINVSLCNRYRISRIPILCWNDYISNKPITLWSVTLKRMKHQPNAGFILHSKVTPSLFY